MDVSSLVADSLLSRRFELLVRAVVIHCHFYFQKILTCSELVHEYQAVDIKCFLGSLVDVDCGGGTYSNTWDY
jgi:hypothetical protein